MKHTLALMFLFALTLPATSQASLFEVLHLVPKVSSISSNSTYAAPDKCANFSGHWKGTCTSTDESGKTFTNPMDETITQVNCSGLSDGHALLEIGKVVTETSPEFVNTMVIDWNSDNTSIKILGAGIMTTTSTVSAGPGHPQDSTVTTHTLLSQEGIIKMENGKLIMSITANVSKGSCILDKQ